MKRVKIVVAYDGTNYCGWQVQPNGLSVQEVLEKHLSDLLCEVCRQISVFRNPQRFRWNFIHALPIR